MKRLVVTADDFGNDVAVNEAVEIAHAQGILTAASLMVGGPAVADAVARAKRRPTLGVGLHLTLVDGTPVLPPEQVPGLVDGNGRFRDNMALAGAAMFFLPVTRRQLAAEIAAQIRRLRGDRAAARPRQRPQALPPPPDDRRADRDHRRTLRPARRPRPARARRTVADRPLGATGGSTFPPPRHRRPRRRVRAEAFRRDDRPTDLRDAIAALPNGLSEIYLHPASRDDYPGHGPAYRHRDELAALLDPRVAEQIAAADVRRGSFAALS